MAASHQKRKISIPKGLSVTRRKVVASAIIDFIVNRTKKGLDKNNVKMAEYSKSYIDSKDFKIAGKRPSKVDLTLSGDMLDSLELLSTGDGYVEIGFKKGTPENDRADGHITGNIGVKRDFLGITNGDKKKVLKTVGIGVNGVSKITGDLAAEIIAGRQAVQDRSRIISGIVGLDDALE